MKSDSAMSCSRGTSGIPCCAANAAGANGRGLSDASESCEAECAAPDARGRVAIPFAATDFLIESREATADGHQHGNGVFGDGVVIAAGSCGDNNLAFVAGGQMDGIESNTGSRQDSHTRYSSDNISGPGF
jgi:hypothetical protein